MKPILSFLSQFFSKINKYYLTGAIFLVFTFFIGDSTILHRFQYDRQINDLENEIAKYKKESEENKKKLELLRSDDESLERFARETYLMTKPGEELFVIK